MKMTFPQFLERKFLEWQNNQGKRKTIAEFAAYIGVSQAVISLWLNGSRKPNQASVQLLARIFGDEVYDAVGLPRPDENLSFIQHAWDELKPSEQRALREQTAKYITKKEKP